MVVESRWRRYPNSRDGRRPPDYEELDALLEAADKSLKKKNLRAANELLKRASVKAAAMWGGTGVPALPSHARALDDLLSQVQRNIGEPGKIRHKAFRTEVSRLRARFVAEARKEA